MRITIQSLIGVVALLSCATVGLATPVKYDVSGSAYAFYGDASPVTGYVYVESPEYIDLEGGAFSLAEDHNQSIFYKFTDFYLDIGDYSFYSTPTGEGGINAHHYYNGSGDSFTTPFDWFYLRGEGDWENMNFLSALVDFYKDDGTPFKNTGIPTDYYSLPSSIVANNIGDDNIYFDELVLAKSTAPVPEPATFLLFAVGMMGVTITKKYRNKKRLMD